jgi:hypothetical protein
MRLNLLLALAFICAAVAPAGAQEDGSVRAAWFAKMGVERSGSDFVYSGPSGRMVLTDDQLRQLNEFEGTLEAAPDAEAVLGGVARRRLADLALGLDSPEGAAWFEKGRLTEAGRLAVPGIVLKAHAPSASASVPTKAEDRSVSRVDGTLAASANPNFDGAASAAAVAAAMAPSGPFSSSGLKPSSPVRPLDSRTLPDAPQPVPKPAHTTLEKDLFWSSWWGYHAAFAADFATTGRVIGRGGYETDPLYTRFGNKNMAGVIGSAIALHAIASVASVALYKEAAKKHGLLRYALDAAAIGINSYGIGAHVQGAGHNVGVLDDWNSPKK